MSKLKYIDEVGDTPTDNVSQLEIAYQLKRIADFLERIGDKQ